MGLGHITPSKFDRTQGLLCGCFPLTYLMDIQGCMELRFGSIYTCYIDRQVPFLCLRSKIAKMLYCKSKQAATIVRYLSSFRKRKLPDLNMVSNLFLKPQQSSVSWPLVRQYLQYLFRSQFMGFYVFFLFDLIGVRFILPLENKCSSARVYMVSIGVYGFNRGIFGVAT